MELWLAPRFELRSPSPRGDSAITGQSVERLTARTHDTAAQARRRQRARGRLTRGPAQQRVPARAAGWKWTGSRWVKGKVGQIEGSRLVGPGKLPFFFSFFLFSVFIHNYFESILNFEYEFHLATNLYKF